MEIQKKLVDPSKYGTKCPYTMKPKYITVHNTYNDASAENEVSYMITNNNEVSFHIAVDDKKAIQGIPLERNAWACGDGNGSGNRESISVEICYSKSGGDRYYKAEENAVDVVRQLMSMYNIPIGNVRTHQSWSGKYCPHRMLAEGRWGAFIQKVKNGNVATTSPTKQNIIQSGAFSPYETPDVMGALTSLKMTADFILQSDGLTYFISKPTSDAQLKAMKEYLDRKGWWYEVK
ncbi:MULTISPECIES: N-acetylmuramoyl-L-alanine amidase C-terminal domain-containing protein [Bacillus cereus group]|uniref:N-acetylmuramoyl-L-alanine amidase C-terminal domain-containing protein n=1 Tax=Bacillus cereus group TaxID=86661 RepID=UPI0009362005|nr:MULTISPECIES: N-acetylmuramoyl-L-alanine amidase C-terminal domain-containing protein [Bacillus cereus group]MBG9840620.1 N-acetylmuramoyl-L-alanine amidase [Bacillus tropicus]MBG9879415.1 N-acetylmuramoyl-L-alanine amidase [Bacillus tropicus]MBG9922888.1 N-acetylmuramoyl-L-alanine amidase [Bacillus tropicus]MBJ8354273.1 N-acetylmuramoyl-L-alanine amidase [Bacillus mycoides]MED2898455.1 N-acetylmuramoyl-L-alanine amidase C-terminal domain-containing protein [Bacillus tropicus]